jgi:TRAP-type C4-dicarboxylate transport system permease small subunit
MPPSPFHRLSRLAAGWRAGEQVLLAVLVVGMVFVSALQIVLRNFFSSGIRWAEPMLGASLLWMTMLGALAATSGDRHITMDVVAQFLPPRGRAGVQALTSLFAAAVCGGLAAAGWRYVALQREMGGMALPSVPQWTIYVVVPVCFALMSLRFALHAGLFAARAAGRAPAEAPR